MRDHVDRLVTGRAWGVLALALLVLLAGGIPSLAQSGDEDGPLVFDPSLRVKVQMPPKLLCGAEQSCHVLIDGSGDRAVVLRAIVERRGAEPVDLFATEVAGDGLHDVAFTVPGTLSSGTVEVTVTAVSPDGIQRVRLEVAVETAAVVTYVSTDKPLYQPGQVIHIRVLALDVITNQTVPEGQPVTIEVRNLQDILVWRRTGQDVETNAYGVIAVDFRLAREVPTGSYTIRAQVGDVAREVNVLVREYQLPKFRVTVETDADYFRPGDNARGTITATYTFGEPVKNGAVNFSIVAFDSETGYELGTLGTPVVGTTDDEGRLPFTYRLPEVGALTYYLTEDETCSVSCRAIVTDEANLVEVGYAMRTLSVQPLFLTLVPENNVLVVGRSNLILARLTYPDGSPARAQLTFGERQWDAEGDVGFEPYTPLMACETDDNGIGVFDLPLAEDGAAVEFFMRRHDVRVVDADANRLVVRWRYEAQRARETRNIGAADIIPLEPDLASFLLRPVQSWLHEDEPVRLRALHVTGDQLRRVVLDELADAIDDDALADGSATFTIEAYEVEIRKFGHVIDTVRFDAAALEAPAGAALDVPRDLYGQIDLVLNVLAYADVKDNANGAIRRSERSFRMGVAGCAVFVPKDDELFIEVVPDQDTYAPGDRDAVIRLHVQRRSGDTTPAILAVDIVDEAVYALEERERELLRLALYLRERTLAESLRTLLADSTLTPEQRQNVSRLLFARAAEPPAVGAAVDSLTYARERTEVVLREVASMIDDNLPYISFAGHMLGERRAETDSDRRRFIAEADPFQWLVEHGRWAEGDELEVSLDDFDDAWGNRLRLVRGYMGDAASWRLVSSGPDGVLDVAGEELAGDDMAAYNKWPARD